MPENLTARIEEGDSARIDAHKPLLQLNVADEVIAKRRAAWKRLVPRYTRGLTGRST